MGCQLFLYHIIFDCGKQLVLSYFSCKLFFRNRSVCCHILKQIRKNIAFGLILTGIIRDTCSSRRPQSCRMIHIIRIKTGFFDLLHRHISCELIDDGTDHLKMCQFFCTDIRQCRFTLLIRHGIALGQVAHTCAEFPIGTAQLLKDMIRFCPPSCRSLLKILPILPHAKNNSH